MHMKDAVKGVFTSLQGTWKLQRQLNSRLTSSPSGIFDGTASFQPRLSDNIKYQEYLYFEEGQLKFNQGGMAHVSKTYVYRYTEKSDELEVWFTKEDRSTCDYFFHRLEFAIQEGLEVREPLNAKSSHLCIKDMYDVEYEFFFQDDKVIQWKTYYSVKGPNKDYTISNTYTRPAQQE